MKRISYRFTGIAIGVLSLMLILAHVSGCALTPKQKQLTAISTHNRIMGDYLNRYDAASPEMQQMLRVKVDPVVKELDDVMGLWVDSVKAGDDPEAKHRLYMGIKDKAFLLFVEYGLDIKEE